MTCNACTSFPLSLCDFPLFLSLSVSHSPSLLLTPPLNYSAAQSVATSLFSLGNKSSANKVVSIRHRGEKQKLIQVRYLTFLHLFFFIFVFFSYLYFLCFFCFCYCLPLWLLISGTSIMSVTKRRLKLNLLKGKRGQLAAREWGGEWTQSTHTHAHIHTLTHTYWHTRFGNPLNPQGERTLLKMIRNALNMRMCCK